MKKSSTILVTGVVGFIESHLAGALLGGGCSVSAVDRFSLGREGNFQFARQSGRFLVEHADARDVGATVRAMRVASDRFGFWRRIVSLLLERLTLRLTLGTLYERPSV